MPEETDEPRYTLGEARRELDRRQCNLQGHDFQIVVTGANHPSAISCNRCGRTWPVGLLQDPTPAP